MTFIFMLYKCALLCLLRVSDFFYFCCYGIFQSKHVQSDHHNCYSVLGIKDLQNVSLES